MNGSSHRLIVFLAVACFDMKYRQILLPRWGGIESGATLSDEQLIMWERIDLETEEKQLVHRCYIDSENTKDHGCVTRALDHTEGSISFIEDFKAGELEGAYDEIEFLENLGMFLGIGAHHISDLCSPVHVGHKIDYQSLGFKTLPKLHQRVEKDIEKYQRRAQITLNTPKKIKLNKEYFWDIARKTYEQQFLNLNSIYSSTDDAQIMEMTTIAISQAVKYTSDVWYTILKTIKMDEREWSLQQLL